MTTGTGTENARILIICVGGLTRFMPALGVLASLRASHPAAHIILLSSPETASFASTAPYFDEVWTDDTKGSWDLARTLNLRRRLQTKSFDRIYDLDCDSHSTFLFRMMYGFGTRKAIAWSGTLPGTALAHTDPHRSSMHLVDRWAAQLKTAGIPATMRPDLSWVARHVKSFNLPFRMTDPFVLLALTPGPAGDGGPGDWRENFAELTSLLVEDGQQAVLVDHQARPDLVAAITGRNPKAIDLTGKATMNELVLLAWAATAAVGADNGIMHLMAVAGCKTVVLYDAASDPALEGQRGTAVTILRRPVLAEIPAAEVMAAIKGRPKPFPRQMWNFS